VDRCIFGLACCFDSFLLGEVSGFSVVDSIALIRKFPSLLLVAAVVRNWNFSAVLEVASGVSGWCL